MSCTLKTKATYIDNESVKKLFEKYDLNRNGVFDTDEFLKIMVDILRELGENLPDKKHIEVAEEGFSKFDINRNGKIEFKIEFNEFFDFIGFLVSEKGYSLN